MGRPTQQRPRHSEFCWQSAHSRIPRGDGVEALTAHGAPAAAAAGTGLFEAARYDRRVLASIGGSRPLDARSAGGEGDGQHRDSRTRAHKRRPPHAPTLAHLPGRRAGCSPSLPTMPTAFRGRPTRRDGTSSRSSRGSSRPGDSRESECSDLASEGPRAGVVEPLLLVARTGSPDGLHSPAPTTPRGSRPDSVPRARESRCCTLRRSTGALDLRLLPRQSTRNTWYCRCPRTAG
jgi:hypothetical protein